MPETEYVTLFSYKGEDAEGNACYRVRVYEAMYEQHAEKEEGRDGVMGARCISGFLFPRSSEYGETCREYGKIRLSVGRDLLCAGDVSCFERPDDAAACGHTLYRLKSAAQPPRFADGLLSDWCHFEGKSQRSRYA